MWLLLDNGSLAVVPDRFRPTTAVRRDDRESPPVCQFKLWPTSTIPRRLPQTTYATALFNFPALSPNYFVRTQFNIPSPPPPSPLSPFFVTLGRNYLGGGKAGRDVDWRNKRDRYITERRLYYRGFPLNK